MAEGREVELLSVALDFQGSDVVKPYVQEANTSFSTVVDSENVLGRVCGFKAVPNGYFLEPGLKVSQSIKGKFDIRNPEILRRTIEWIGSPTVTNSEPYNVVDEKMTPDVERLFESGLKLYREGNEQEGITEWQKLIAVDPNNYIVRKQVWAIMYPDKFYDGEVDFEWQRRQMKYESSA